MVSTDEAISRYAFCVGAIEVTLHNRCLDFVRWSTIKLSLASTLLDQIAILCYQHQQNLSLITILFVYFFQVLKPSHSPLPNIYEIHVNILATQIAAVSTRGVNILELPARWGRESDFQGGLSEIIVR